MLATELLEPFRMRLGTMAPPALAFGVTAPMFFLAGERVVALVCFTALRRMSVNGIAIAIVRWLFFVFVLVFALGFLLVVAFVFVRSKEDTTLFLGWIPSSFLFQSSFGVLSLHQNFADIFQQRMFHRHEGVEVLTKASHRALGILVQQQRRCIHRDFVVDLQEGEKLLPNAGMFCRIVVVEIVQAKSGQTGAQTVDRACIAESNLVQGEIQSQRSYVMLLLISIKASLHMELESIVFDRVENCFCRPHEILIPREITRVEREVGT